MQSKDIFELAEKLIYAMKAKKTVLATAESCTGGMLSGSITAIPGSSAVFDRGFVTYSNESKTDLLNVPHATIEEKGAVSEEVATFMSIGALNKSKANVSISMTGIAGPSGGSISKPVGLVWVSINFSGKIYNFKNTFSGGRESVREQAVKFCLEELIHLHTLV